MHDPSRDTEWTGFMASPISVSLREATPADAERVAEVMLASRKAFLAFAHRRTRPFPIRLYTFQQNAGARRFYGRSGFASIQFTDGSANEERCPDVLYELASPVRAGV